MTRRAPFLPLLAACLWGTSGCAGAGLAAVGPVVAAVQLVSDRSVERTLPADLETVTSATIEAFNRMAIPVRRSHRETDGWNLETTGKTIAVTARLARVTPALTRVSVRVEAGRLQADKQTSQEILNQVASVLEGERRAAAGEPGGHGESELLTELRREVLGLRSVIEQTRAARPPAEPALSNEPAPARSAVVVIPESYGIPTRGAGRVETAPAVEERRPAPAAREPRPEPQTSTADIHPEAQVPAADVRPEHALAIAPLGRVGVLNPVQPLSAGRRAE
jgi:hypothetical protein